MPKYLLCVVLWQPFRSIVEIRIQMVISSRFRFTGYFLFVCSYYGSLRTQFLPDYFVNYPSESKFKYLMDINNVTLKTNICKYLIEALKLRSELLLMHRI